MIDFEDIYLALDVQFHFIVNLTGREDSWNYLVAPKSYFLTSLELLVDQINFIYFFRASSGQIELIPILLHRNGLLSLHFVFQMGL